MADLLPMERPDRAIELTARGLESLLADAARFQLPLQRLAEIEKARDPALPRPERDRLVRRVITGATFVVELDGLSEAEIRGLFDLAAAAIRLEVERRTRQFRSRWRIEISSLARPDEAA